MLSNLFCNSLIAGFSRSTLGSPREFIVCLSTIWSKDCGKVALRDLAYSIFIAEPRMAGAIVVNNVRLKKRAPIATPMVWR